MNVFKLPVLVVFLILSMMMASTAHEADKQNGGDKPQIKSLITHLLQGVPGTEVILSHVVLPPNVKLPKHWHPGEEFAYVLQGSITVTLDGQDDKMLEEGKAAVVPLKRIHHAQSGGKGVTLLVFRVHEKGKPERVLVK